MKKLYSLIVLALYVLLLAANCGERGIQPAQINGSGSIEGGEVSLRLPIPKALADQVARVEAVVSANDMQTITQDLTIDESGDAKGTIRNVPAGLARIVTLNAYDAGGTLIYTGSSRVDVVTGETAIVAIILKEVNPSGPFFVYVVNETGDMISVINGELNEVILGIPGPGGHLGGIAISPTSNIVWVEAGSGISILDLDTNRWLISIDIALGLREIIFSPDGALVYLLRDPYLYTYTTSDYTESKRIRLASGNPTEYLAMCLSPDNQSVYLTDRYLTDEVFAFRISDGTQMARVGAGGEPQGIDITPDGEYVYVTNNADNTVSVISTRTFINTNTIQVGEGPRRLAVSSNGSLVCVANWDGNSVSIISTSNNDVVATVDVGQQPYEPAITPDNQFAYVTNSGDNTVSVIDLSTYTVTATIQVGWGPWGIAIK